MKRIFSAQVQNGTTAQNRSVEQSPFELNHIDKDSNASLSWGIIINLSEDISKNSIFSTLIRFGVGKPKITQQVSHIAT